MYYFDTQPRVAGIYYNFMHHETNLVQPVNAPLIVLTIIVFTTRIPAAPPGTNARRYHAKAAVI